MSPCTIVMVIIYMDMIEGGKLSTILVANKGINVWSVYSSIMWDDKRWWMVGGGQIHVSLCLSTF